MKILLSLVLFCLCAIPSAARFAISDDGNSHPCRRIVTPGDGIGAGSTCRCSTIRVDDGGEMIRRVCVREVWEGYSMCLERMPNEPCPGGSEIKEDGCE